MTGAFDVQGADRLAATMQAAADELGDLTAVNKRVGDLIVSPGPRGKTPELRSGRLSSHPWHAVPHPGNPSSTWGARSRTREPIHNGWPAHPHLPQTLVPDRRGPLERGPVGRSVRGRGRRRRRGGQGRMKGLTQRACA